MLAVAFFGGLSGGLLGALAMLLAREPAQVTVHAQTLLDQSGGDDEEGDGGGEHEDGPERPALGF